MAGESTAELKIPAPSKDPESVPQEIQEANFHLMNAIRASRFGNGDFFVDMGKKAERVEYLRADRQAIILKEGRKNPESDRFDYVVFTRLGPKIVTTSEREVERSPNMPSSGTYVRRPEHYSYITTPDIALRYGGSDYVPMRDVVSETDRDFVREALVNSIIAGKEGLIKREIASARRIASEQKMGLPKKEGEKAMLEEISAFVTETAHDSLVLRRSPRLH